ncbi:MAG: hypothetical protein ACKON9_22625, partial [Planctomycetaceae bacterium]
LKNYAIHRATDDCGMWNLEIEVCEWLLTWLLTTAPATMFDETTTGQPEICVTRHRRGFV